MDKEIKQLEDRIKKLEKISNSLFGSSYSNVGSSSSDFLIKTRGKVKIQWGNKYIDLIKDGAINVDAKFIYSATEVGSNDGIYVIGSGEDAQIILVSGGQQIELKGKNEESVTYVSFLSKQETTATQKYQALTNIGFIYSSIEDVPDFTSGIVYIEDSQKLYTISDGNLEEYSFTFPNPFTDTFVIQKDNTEQGALVIKGTGKGNSLAFDSMFIYSDSSKNYIDSTNNLLIKIGNDQKIAIERDSNVFSKKIVTPTIESTSATPTTGFKLSVNNGKSLLEIDSINVRDGLNIKMPCDIYSQYWYNEVNYIKNAKNKSDKSEDFKTIQITLINTNTYQEGDVLCVYNNDTYVLLTVIYVKENTIKITCDNINISELEQQSIFLVYRSGGIKLLKRTINNLDLIPVIEQSDESNLSKINSRYGDLSELKLKEKIIIDSKISNPDIIGLGLYSKQACFLKAQYVSDYDLNIEDKSSKLASTEWVCNKMGQTFPIGSIIMFNGTASEIPEGWHICDGSEGTPNLIGKFIKAATSSGTEGGNSEIEILEENMPKHTHTFTGSTVKTSEAGVHTHTFRGKYGQSDNANDRDVIVTGDETDLITTSSSGAHTHTIDMSSTQLSYQGEGKPIKWEPSYYSLIYIMKIK